MKRDLTSEQAQELVASRLFDDQEMQVVVDKFVQEAYMNLHNGGLPFEKREMVIMNSVKEFIAERVRHMDALFRP